MAVAAFWVLEFVGLDSRDYRCGYIPIIDFPALRLS